jgi:hypothetical protein
VIGVCKLLWPPFPLSPSPVSHLVSRAGCGALARHLHGALSISCCPRAAAGAELGEGGGEREPKAIAELPSDSVLCGRHK